MAGHSIDEKPLDDVHHLEHNKSLNYDGAETGTGHEAIPLDPKEDKQVKRKIDLVLMPVLCFIYALNFLDKTALTYASVMGLMKDTNINGAQYSWVASIYYFGYLVGTYPMVFGLQRLPIAKFTSFNIIAWGVTVSCTGACSNYESLLGLRFLLGIFESGMVPAIMLIVAEWYKPREQGTRTGVWGSMTSWGCILGGGVAYALAERQKAGTLKLAGWKIVFIWLGAMTIFAGILFLWVVPDSIESAWWLNDHQKQIAHRRTLENKQHIGEKEWKWYQVREVLSDPQCWLLAAITICSNIPTGGLVNFFAIIVSGIGYTPAETLLLTMANASLGAATMFFMWAGDKARCRTLVSGLGPLISIAGGAMLWALPREQKIARLVGFYLTIWNSVATYIVTSFVTTNIAGRTKKSIVSAGYICVFCVGNLIGPQTFRPKDAPVYAPALITMIVLTSINIGLLVTLFFYYRAQNAKRDRLHGRPEEIKRDEWVDLTDRENPSYRYVY